LYWNLNTYLQSQLVEISNAAARRDTGEIPIFYLREWKRYRVTGRILQAVCRYLDLHWIQREQNQGKKAIYDVYTQSLVRWRQDFLDTEKRIVPSILALVEKHRNGEAVETSLIKIVVDSFVAVSVDEAGYGKKTMETYRCYFERPFLEATRAFYRAESKQLLAKRSIVEYMKKVSDSR
jgi:cullin 1